jgi:uncharacterized membrane protein (DUF485 family)
MVSPEPNDPASHKGSLAVIGPAGGLTAEPSRELTAEEEFAAEWAKIAAREESRSLLHGKARFIVPGGIFFLICYLALPALAGYRPDFMETRVGPVNIAYLFAFAQFFILWIVAALYVRAANILDRDANAILDDTHKHLEPKQRTRYHL